jgi:thiosulfate/3-mercaptopyruvate sulfurtransferase
MKYPFPLALTLTLAAPLLTVAPKAEAQAVKKAATPAVRAEMLVSTDWLAKNLNNPKVVVLHVSREQKHYDAGHVPGARFLPFNELVATRGALPNELPPVSALQQLFSRLGVGDDTRVVLYGENFGLLAARAFYTLDYLGHGHHAALLDGGLEKWQAEKREVSTAAPAAVKPATFTPRPQPRVSVTLDAMRDLSWVAANSSTPNVAVIDARPGADYLGTTPDDGLPRRGHIAGATSLYWMQHLTSREMPTLKPAAELRKMYEEAGATPGKTVVTYCRTGVQASHSYFVAKYLGYDAAMYDGSFVEWSKAEGAPVVAGEGKK